MYFIPGCSFTKTPETMSLKNKDAALDQKSSLEEFRPILLFMLLIGVIIWQIFHPIVQIEVLAAHTLFFVFAVGISLYELKIKTRQKISTVVILSAYIILLWLHYDFTGFSEFLSSRGIPMYSGLRLLFALLLFAFLVRGIKKAGQK